MTFDELFNYYANYGFTKPTSPGGLGSLVKPTSIPTVSGVSNIETLTPTTTVENRALESTQPLNVLQFEGGGDEAFSGNIDTTNNAGIASLGDIPGVVSNVFDAAVSRINPLSLLGTIIGGPLVGFGIGSFQANQAAKARASAIAQEQANRDAARGAAAAAAAAAAQAAANRDRARGLQTGGDGNNNGPSGPSGAPGTNESGVGGPGANR